MATVVSTPDMSQWQFEGNMALKDNASSAGSADDRRANPAWTGSSTESAILSKRLEILQLFQAREQDRMDDRFDREEVRAQLRKIDASAEKLLTTRT